MGFLIAFSRKMYLTAYVNKLESKLNDITTQKLNLTDTISQLTSQISDIGNTDSPAVKQLEARKAELESLDKQLEVRMFHNILLRLFCFLSLYCTVLGSTYWLAFRFSSCYPLTDSHM